MTLTLNAVSRDLMRKPAKNFMVGNRGDFWRFLIGVERDQAVGLITLWGCFMP